jgi:hypothetical protein
MFCSSLRDVTLQSDVNVSAGEEEDGTQASPLDETTVNELEEEEEDMPFDIDEFVAKWNCRRLLGHVRYHDRQRKDALLREIVRLYGDGARSDSADEDDFAQDDARVSAGAASSLADDTPQPSVSATAALDIPPPPPMPDFLLRSASDHRKVASAPTQAQAEAQAAQAEAQLEHLIRLSEELAMHTVPFASH